MMMISNYISTIDRLSRAPRALSRARRAPSSRPPRVASNRISNHSPRASPLASARRDVVVRPPSRPRVPTASAIQKSSNASIPHRSHDWSNSPPRRAPTVFACESRTTLRSIDGAIDRISRAIDGTIDRISTKRGSIEGVGRRRDPNLESARALVCRSIDGAIDRISRAIDGAIDRISTFDGSMDRHRVEGSESLVSGRACVRACAASARAWSIARRVRRRRRRRRRRR